MVKKLKHSYYIFTLLFILILIICSFMDPKVFQSLFFTIILVLYAGISLSALVWGPNWVQKTIHILMACLILAVVVEKSNRTDNTQMLSLGECGEYEYVFDEDTIQLELLDFRIETAGDSIEGMPIHFESSLLLNREDTVNVSVNHPLKIESYKIYQQYYGDMIKFMVALDNDTIRLFPGQKGDISGKPIELQASDPQRQRISLSYCDVNFKLAWYDSTKLCGMPVYTQPCDTVEGTVLYVVPVKGHTIILIIVLLMLAVLAYDLYRQESKWN